MTIILGIDISKAKFDVTFLNTDKLKTDQPHQTFDNTLKGFELLLKDLGPTSEITVGLEATGIYGENLCQFLYDQGCRVFLLNPVQVKFYGKSMMKRAKTDKADSTLIAHFLAVHQEELIPWHPKSNTLARLQNLQSCLTDLKEDRGRVLGRIEASSHTSRSGRADALKTYNEQQEFLDQQIEKVQTMILSLVESNEILKKQYEALISIQGVGSLTAFGLLALLPDLSYFSHAKQLTAFAGLNPAVKQSGSSVRGRGSVSKQGSAALRKLLYMPALSAKRHNKVLSVFAKGLEERGKPAKVIIVAVMRKLLHYIFSLLKKGGATPKLAS